MKIHFIGAAWGCPGNTFAEQCEHLANAGFVGVEVQPERTDSGVREQEKIATDFGLRLILQPHTQGSTVEEHCADMQAHLQRAELVDTWFVTCHTGLDHFGTAANLKVAAVASEWSARTGVMVTHEIHRKRICYNAMLGQELRELAPDLLFTADFSHWVVVHENYLDSPAYGVSKMLDACTHIHARVGHPNSPQVADPFAPEWQVALEKHLAWWDGIIATQRANGRAEITICPEFGPPDYCPTMPRTREPLVDVFAINCQLKDFLAERYQS